MPVFNVAMPLLTRTNPARAPYLIFEVPLADGTPSASQPPSGALSEPVVKSA